jgi:hypothetical protein
VRALTRGWHWLPIVLNVLAYIGTGLMALYAGLNPKEWGTRSWWLFGTLLFCGAAGSILAGVKEVQTARLREENARLAAKLGDRDYFKTFDDLAEIFAAMLGCGEADRITIYLRSDNSFLVLGRYAKRPQLAQRARPLYPSDEGLIAVAWRDGWAFEPCLPHPDTNEYSVEVEKRWKIPRSIVEKMRMKARFIGGSVVADTNRKSLAVLVVESRKCRRWPEAQLRTFGEGAARAVAQMLHVMKPYEPNPLVAKNEGL